MARSQYYGDTGSSVEETQTSLNAQGANLKVDGIWGGKTEAAYNTYGTGTSAETPVDTTNTTSKLLTDAEISKTAKSFYDPQYQAALSSNDQTLQNTLDAITASGEDYQVGLARTRTAAEKAIRDSNITRGVGRGSIEEDMLGSAFANIALKEENFLEDMSNQRVSAQQLRDDTAAQLKGSYDTSVLNRMFDLRQQNQSFYQWLQEFDLAKSQIGGSGPADDPDTGYVVGPNGNWWLNGVDTGVSANSGGDKDPDTPGGMTDSEKQYLVNHW